MNPDARSANTQNTIRACALAGNPNECLANPNDTSPCYALAVNSVVSPARTVNAVSRIGLA